LLGPPDASTNVAIAEGEAQERGGRVAAAVEQLMREQGLDRPGAFNMMTERSRTQQIKLRTVAEQILDGEGEQS
jgi:AmiR/NasT family two-component response regulator